MITRDIESKSGSPDLSDDVFFKPCMSDEARLREIYDFVIQTATKQIEWYNSRAAYVWRISRRVRLAAIASGTLGALFPIASIVLPNGAQFSNFGYIFLALAAAFVTADSAFGWSSSWIRFRSAQLELEKHLLNFRFQWVLERAKANSELSDESMVGDLLKIQLEFLEAVQSSVASETSAWIQEFRTSLSELARSYKSAAMEQKPGAIDVRLQNAAKADGDLLVTVDRKSAGKIVGDSCQILDVPPGVHAVEVRGQIGGVATGTSSSVQVRPGEVSTVELALPERNSSA